MNSSVQLQEAALWRRADHIAFLVLAAIFFIGVGHCLLTPPFEGFDENAHYAYVQLIADENRAPANGVDLLSADTETDYFSKAPRAYSPEAPFHENRGLTYAEIFASPGAADRARRAVKDRPTTPRRYRPAGDQNWQAQHGPLAYAALVPVYHATKHLSWGAHLFWLRAACWSIAVAGFAIGLLATRGLFKNPDTISAAGRPAYLIAAAFPFLTPMFFPEFARLGNDAFCLLFAGVAWAALLRILSRGSQEGFGLLNTVVLGGALAAGALTKAFFIPISVGVVGFLAARAAHEAIAGQSRSISGLANRLAPIVVILLMILIGAGWWYLQKFLATGSLTGGHDFVQFNAESASRDVSFWALAAENFSISIFAKRLASIYFSFIWTGTWSLAKLSYEAVAILGLFIALALIRFFLDTVRQGNILNAPGAVLFFAAPMLAGLAFHAGLQVIRGGHGTPGYYFHILSPMIAAAIALGFIPFLKTRPGFLLCAAGAAYAIALGLTAQYYQLALFSGCASKVGENRFYQPADCFSDISEIIERLTAITDPAAGLTCFAIGSGVCLIALLKTVRSPAVFHSRVS